MNRELAKYIGTATREARKRMGLTLYQAAAMLGVSHGFYNRVERGTSMPSIVTFARIVQVLGVDANAVFRRNGIAEEWTTVDEIRTCKQCLVIIEEREPTPCTGGRGLFRFKRCQACSRPIASNTRHRCATETT